VDYATGDTKSGEAWAVCDLNQDGVVDDTHDSHMGNTDNAGFRQNNAVIT